MGDPAGVGPELCCHMAADPVLNAHSQITVYGDPALLQRVAEHCQIPLPSRIHAITTPIAAHTITPGVVSSAAGTMAIASLDAAIDACLGGQEDALVTAPIHKGAVHAAGFRHPGHTEYLAQRCGKAKVAMALTGPSLTVALATVHRSLASVAQALTAQELISVGNLLHQALRMRLRRPPRLACVALNPHAGENGLFGDEEVRIIRPALAHLRAAGIDISDPLSPDSAFTPKLRKLYDGHLCCYHDQGLIPFKMLHFHDGVNWTLGLPIIRTSPDHGTAFDIAWRGTVDQRSMRAAVSLATQLTSD
ncbi:MAG: 4-hydroxythreonine-4-phosphate dehydrogenase PdxA [Planctomycetota bacterium]|nr:MAG: 4-hydroxythreonine-4-phosphate dehydrogenase PdxA [Planctomycetota bacterium]